MGKKLLFKGFYYSPTRTVVPLPQEHWTGSIKNEMTFGKVCPADKPGAIQTTWKYDGSGLPVFAKPIPCKGHSLTNLMYGETHAYLLYDGKMYMRPLKNKRTK
jgi:hypothetical protein